MTSEIFRVGEGANTNTSTDPTDAAHSLKPSRRGAVVLGLGREEWLAADRRHVNALLLVVPGIAVGRLAREGGLRRCLQQHLPLKATLRGAQASLE